MAKVRFDVSNKYIEKEKKKNPNNLLPLLIENYIEALKVFVNEDEQDLRTYEKNAAKRLSIIEEKGDKNSPFYRYAIAELNLQSVFARIKFEEYFTAFWELRTCYTTLVENQEKFPHFTLNLKTLGCLHAIIGTLPDNYKWGLRILGMTGDIEQGMNELRSFVNYSENNGRIFFEEGQLLYTFFLIYLDTAFDEARTLIFNKIDASRSLLNVLVVSDVAFRLGETDYAIDILENRPQTSDYYKVWGLDYMLGSFKLFRGDEDADIHLKKFLDNFGGRHYVKDAYQKLAWYYLLKNNTEKYVETMKKCGQYGETLVDADKKAHKASKNTTIPNRHLLQARLYFDGGYHQKALQALNKVSINSFNKHTEQLEYYYRLARINEGLQKDEEAIKFYQKTIDFDKNTGLYFAPKSALQIGLINERNKNYSEAKKFFNQCFAYSDHAYKSSIDQQAKAGLNRIKNKL